jgi:hypothetical protein
MRTEVLTLLGALVLSAAAMPANPANASLTIGKLGAPKLSNVIEASGGCGRQYYRDVYGYCRPHYYGYAERYRYSDSYGYPDKKWHPWQYEHRDR